MKDNFGAMVLTVVLLMCVLVTTFLSYRFVILIGRTQLLQMQVERVNRAVGVMNALAVDAQNYRQKNPAIQPILDWVTAKPAGK